MEHGSTKRKGFSSSISLNIEGLKYLFGIPLLSLSHSLRLEHNCGFFPRNGRRFQRIQRRWMGVQR